MGLGSLALRVANWVCGPDIWTEEASARNSSVFYLVAVLPRKSTALWAKNCNLVPAVPDQYSLKRARESQMWGARRPTVMDSGNMAFKNVTMGSAGQVA